LRSILAKEIQRRDAQFEDERERFGDMHHIVSLPTVDGDRVTVVGDTVIRSRPDLHFHDYLRQLLKTLLTEQWIAIEQNKPPKEAHQIADWLSHSSWFKGSTPGGFHAQYNGADLALLRLAYDLFTVANNARLTQELRGRLLLKTQFQAARHELMVASIFVIGGFGIDFVDASLRAGKVPEFKATHRGNGYEVAVEAKSKHRPGVLGYAAPPKAVTKANVSRLLNQAFKKDSLGLPFVIMLDLNLPSADPFESEWGSELKSTINRFERNRAGVHPPMCVIATSDFCHYHLDDPIVAGNSYFWGLARHLDSPEYWNQEWSLVQRLLVATRQRHTIPESLDDIRGYRNVIDLADIEAPR
jgi:hypothetical protein